MSTRYRRKPQTFINVSYLRVSGDIVEPSCDPGNRWALEIFGGFGLKTGNFTVFSTISRYERPILKGTLKFDNFMTYYVFWDALGPFGAISDFCRDFRGFAPLWDLRTSKGKKNCTPECSGLGTIEGHCAIVGLF